MSIKDNSIDFCEQKAIFENLGRVRKISRMSIEEENNQIIGLTMLRDSNMDITGSFKACLPVKATSEKPCVTVFVSFEKTRQKFDFDLLQINPKAATLVEMFALCSYADHNHLCEGVLFGSFERLKNYFYMDGLHKIYGAGKSFEQYVNERYNWEEILHIMKGEYLDAGLYAQYQYCLQLLDIVDYFNEKRYHAPDEMQDDTDNISVQQKASYKADKTAETVMEMIKKERYKYCID